MSQTKTIKTALISVFHKDGLEEMLSLLHQNGVEFLSTGGTQHFIESLGYPCKKVEEVTTYPSILGGRVKTLHPKIQYKRKEWNIIQSSISLLFIVV